MKIQEILTITELSRLLGKSRPSVYKYISDYENGNYENVPVLIKELFDNVNNGKFNKVNVYDYCYKFLIGDNQDEIKEIYELIKENQSNLDLCKIKEYILKEIENVK